MVTVGLEKVLGQLKQVQVKEKMFVSKDSNSPAKGKPKSRAKVKSPCPSQFADNPWRSCPGTGCCFEKRGQQRRSLSPSPPVSQPKARIRKISRHRHPGVEFRAEGESTAWPAAMRGESDDDRLDPQGGRRVLGGPLTHLWNLAWQAALNQPFGQGMYRGSPGSFARLC